MSRSSFCLHVFIETCLDLKTKDPCTSNKLQSITQWYGTLYQCTTFFLYTPQNNGWLVQNKYCIEFHTIYLFLITKSHISIQVYQVFNMVRCSNSWSSIYPALFVFPHCYLLVTLMSVVRCSNSWSSIYPVLFVLPHCCSTVPTNVNVKM